MLESKVQFPSRAPEACCTCTRLIPSLSHLIIYDIGTEKPRTIYDRRLPCCGRIICAACIQNNPRFATYCPFCQISQGSSSLPKDGLREPPSYKDDDAKKAEAVEKELGQAEKYQRERKGEPPGYEEAEAQSKEDGKGQDIVHHLHHPRDTIQSLSIQYGVPPAVLRRQNKLTDGNFLLARHTILIPSSHYNGPSLSDTPQADPEEDERRKKIRRFMVQCKVSEYEVAKMYLEHLDWEMEKAVEGWNEDEEWERLHPLKAGVNVDKNGKET